MPNHVTNVTKFIGDEEKVKALLESIKGEEECIDFEKIVPMPESIKNTESGSRANLNYDAYMFLEYDTMSSYLKRYLKDTIKENKDIDLEDGKNLYTNEVLYGARDWYEWSIKYWGTKWNAYYSLEEYDGRLEYDTAWSSPEPIICKLIEDNPDITIEHIWADEDLGFNTGRIFGNNGKAVVEYVDDRSALAYEIIEQTKGLNNCIYLDENDIIQYRSCDDGCKGCDVVEVGELYPVITKLK